MRSACSPLTISIHALRVEGDLETCRSTFKISNFYPRPPGGGRHSCVISLLFGTGFLSTPSGWRATLRACTPSAWIIFLSTPSGWRATDIFMHPFHLRIDFYPRPPGGGRPPKDCIADTGISKFLSTPSGWRATRKSVAKGWLFNIFLSTPSGWRATLKL